jgi:branched-chain amino acid transport system substrate-binding protein
MHTLWGCFVAALLGMGAGPTNAEYRGGPIKIARAVIAKIKELPNDDKPMGQGKVREDGGKIHPMYLFEVRKPEESKGAWDYYKQLATIAAEDAWRPLDQGDCPLVKH